MNPWTLLVVAIALVGCSRTSGSARGMPEETRSAIAGLFDGFQFARGEALSDLFDWYGQANLPYWLILDGETIIGIEEQYLP